jgi:hypothetical protein
MRNPNIYKRPFFNIDKNDKTESKTLTSRPPINALSINGTVKISKKLNVVSPTS